MGIVCVCNKDTQLQIIHATSLTSKRLKTTWELAKRLEEGHCMHVHQLLQVLVPYRLVRAMFPLNTTLPFMD